MIPNVRSSSFGSLAQAYWEPPQHFTRGGGGSASGQAEEAGWRVDQADVVLKKRVTAAYERRNSRTVAKAVDTLAKPMAAVWIVTLLDTAIRHRLPKFQLTPELVP